MSDLRNNYGRLTHSQVSILLRSMTLDGDPNGDVDANVDGSVTPVRFYVAPPPGVMFEIVQVGVEVSDSGNPGINDYGNVPGPLTNGIQFYAIIGGVEFLTFRPVVSNRQLINLGPVISRTDFSGNTSVSTYTFNGWEHAKEGFFLKGNDGDRFGVIIQDDLSTLADHNFVIKGSINLSSVP